jgi:hypothetical protein
MMVVLDKFLSENPDVTALAAEFFSKSGPGNPQVGPKKLAWCVFPDIFGLVQSIICMGAKVLFDRHLTRRRLRDVYKTAIDSLFPPREH